MVKGFVFGKFLPFHNGHKAMIEFALQYCDRITVLVCSSDREQIPGAIRQQWITETFANNPNVRVLVFEYFEAALPNSSESSMEISRLWAAAFATLVPDHTVVVTSEPYGDYVADCMHIRHIMFDQKRVKVPVAATNIRTDLARYWSFLPDSVKPFFAYKVVILGTESTGKTTLTQQLAAYFNCSWVLEAGRDIVENSNQFTIEDLHKVAMEHVNRIQAAVKGNSHLVIIDTDIHITESYGRYALGTQLMISDDIYTANKAHLYLYLNNDVPHIQDGTRLSERQRNLLDQSHRRVLADYVIDLVEVRGNWQERFKTAVAAIQALIGDS